MSPKRSFLPGSAAALLLFTLVACSSRQPGDPLRPGFNTFSVEQDIELGREAAAEVRKQVDVVDNQQLQDYIGNLGQSLAKQPEAGEYPYSFTLINEDSLNAFALPGGPIFVHGGLLEATENEGQLVGVLAHEISHVALRHGTSQASKATLFQLPAVIAGAAIGQDSVLGQLGQVGIGVGLNSIILKYSREAEREADALGARIMSGAGYNPLEMARFFETLAAEGGSSGLPQFLSSHPDPGNRVENVQAEMRTFPQREYTAGTGRFDQAKQLVASLPPPNPPAQQQLARNTPPPPAPTGAFRQYSNDSYAVSFPGQWQAFGGQGSPTTTLAPQQGLVQSGNGAALGYGAVLSMFPTNARTLRAATQELINQLQQTDRNLRVSSAARGMQVNGRAALLTQMTGRSPYGGGETDLLLTVATPRGLFYMIMVAPEQSFAQVQPVFERMAQSLQFAG